MSGTTKPLPLGSASEALLAVRQTEQQPKRNVKMSSVAIESPPTNRLGREKSPYLLQHQHNPVDWYPWGEEAFTRARAEQKPIFVSIGYSTCHWCHVMERESFENPATAAFLNEHFISIKVDREERPDVDKIYMTFVQATTGQGGWPLNVFLAPDLKPFFGGTYFPPDNRQGRSSFLEVLRQLQRVWSTEKAEITRSAHEIHLRMQAATAGGPAEHGALSEDTVRQAGLKLKQGYDPVHGGFGSAPKFPQPSQPLLLLRYARKFQDAEALRMVLHTCDAMAAGGIHDQLGGGFSRYAVDAQWLVPHFEKMLYDNAQLAQLYLEAYLVSRDPHHAEVARGIIDYVLHDMTHAEGGFFSAEDADSEGHEGKFYCWTRAELRELLAPEEFNLATRYFGITQAGNFIDHSHRAPLLYQNVLSVAAPQLTPAEQPLLEAAKRKMAAARAQRVRPHLDDKILASWNGLMLGALARAYAVLDHPAYRAAAERNLDFIKAKLWDADTQTLFHRWRDGERDRVQLLDAYAFLLAGVLDLYEATLEPKHLDFALLLAEAMLARFYDADHGGFWQNGAGASDLILRLKEDYDGAEPSGNSVAVFALLRLGKITGRKEFSDAAEKTLRLFGGRLQDFPQSLPFMLCALDFALQEPRRVAITGDPSHPGLRALLHSAHSVYRTDKVVIFNKGAVAQVSKNLTAYEPQAG